RASRSASTRRSVASSRFRHWLRSSCATARSTGPARAVTRRFWAGESADEASTSKIASTRVSFRCACWPPGPLEREKRSPISLRGKRVLALTMPAIVEDLDGVELVGEGADAVLVGGAGEDGETGRVFSYMNLARAFAELHGGAELYCLHKNRWWQTRRGAMLDAGVYVAGLEYATEMEATVLGKPSAAYFAAALDALEYDPEQTWMVGDDVEADIGGASAFGLRTILVRTGKFREEALDEATVKPDGVIDSIAA